MTQQILEKSIQRPQQRVIAKAVTMAVPVIPEIIDTPQGPEQVIKQTVLERRVERDETGEKVIKHLGITDIDPCTGAAKQIAVGIEQLDPRFAKDEGREVISTTSKVSVTPTYTSVQKITSRAITQPLTEAADLTAADIAKMVDEEKEDVENTLKIFPPDLITQPGKI
ncbi:hypothetical protein NQ318_019025 [Aromia moschata]|uniref:Uncharacterized protein n=1 Tax=Aromia moschata TaxID=1265417 RepID=A0AAV8Y481_9CUCU|nr:hypothetical protein NQ318_019025 [Aromia moschata]